MHQFSLTSLTILAEFNDMEMVANYIKIIDLENLSRLLQACKVSQQEISNSSDRKKMCMQT